MSRVDVVVPCYKYAHYLRECVMSILTQQGVDVRVLIIDDCSPDNTPEVGRKLAEEDARVEYRRHGVNRGHIATYNEGLLGWASGDYCLLLSADDHLRPGALRRAADLLDSDPSITLCYGRDIVHQTGDELDADGLPARVKSSASELLPPGIGARPAGKTVVMEGGAFLEMCSNSCDNPVPTATAVVRTSAQLKVGGYSDALPHAGDMEMWIRLASLGRVGFVDAYQAYYRWHGRNMQNTYIGPARFKDLDQRIKALSVMRETAGDTLPHRERLIARASHHIAECAVIRAHDAFDNGDIAGCEACVEYAINLDAGIVATRAFSKLKWKRRIGTTGTSLLRRAYRALRRVEVHPPQVATP